MLQLRIVLCLLLIAIVAVSAIAAQPLKEEGLQQSLLDVNVQGHENAGERLARQGRRGARQYRSRGEMISRQNRQRTYVLPSQRYRRFYG